MSFVIESARSRRGQSDQLWETPLILISDNSSYEAMQLFTTGSVLAGSRRVRVAILAKSWQRGGCSPGPSFFQIRLDALRQWMRRAQYSQRGPLEVLVHRLGLAQVAVVEFGPC